MGSEEVFLPRMTPWGQRNGIDLAGLEGLNGTQYTNDTNSLTMKMLQISLGVVAPGSFLGVAAGQTFANLNFESAKNLGTPPSASESAANAFPAWTVTAPQAVCYDTISLSGGSVSIIDTNANNGGLNFPKIQGNYFCLLEGLNGPPFYNGMEPTSIAQTGQERRRPNPSCSGGRTKICKFHLQGIR